MPSTALVHLGAGIGNVVLATPLLIALHDLGFTTDVLLAADYAQTAELLRPWAAVRNVVLQSGPGAPTRHYDRIVPAIPPYYFNRYGRALAKLPNALTRPSDALFYRDEQTYYFTFARTLGYVGERAPPAALPIGPSEEFGITQQTVVLAPGCKTGEMAAKRWPRFVELANTLDDVAIVGTEDDMRLHDGREMKFPAHVRLFVGKLSLRETAELMAAAGAVVGNDSGLSHVACAVGTPTLMLFGPSPDATLGKLAANATVIRRGLPCEPCLFGERFVRCEGRITCLAEIDVARVRRAVDLALA